MPLAARPAGNPGRRGESMFDLLIRGERVVTPQGVGQWEIAVKDGVIAALGAPGTLSARRRRASSTRRGKIVMPGGIDPHVHCAWYIPPHRPGGSPRHQRPARAGQPRGALGRHHHAHRLRRVQARPRGRRVLQPERARRDRGARQGLGRQMLLRLRVPRDAARQGAAGARSPS